MKRKLIDLSNQRTQHLQAAETALKANNVAEYDSEMEKVSNLNTEISRVKTLLDEQDREILAKQPSAAEARDMAEERGNTLMNGGEVKITALEIRRAIMNSTTLATGTIVEPTGAGSQIRDPLGNQPSSIVDQVYVQDLTGMGSFLEPYVITEMKAKSGKVTTKAGTTRENSTSPTFGVAKISPYEMTVTDYVDINIGRLSPANYGQKIQSMAMRAMRRELAKLIVNGDGQATPDFFGIKTAKNVAGSLIYATENVSAVDDGLLDTLFFAYGSDEAIGQNARLYLSKADLRAIGKLRNSDKERVFKIRPDGGNPNIGAIEDGGVIVPYTIAPDLTALATSVAGSAAIQTMLYGDPMNFEVGLFGDYTIRVDSSYKAADRLLTILGDAMVGGNLIVDKVFVIATLPKIGT